MSIKYFGEFLVEKKIVTSDVLVAALVEQMEALPSLVKIIMDQKLMDSGSILSALSCQQEKGFDFKSACVHLNFWTPNLEETINEELKKKRTPIGQILINRGAIDLKKLTMALDEFLSQVPESKAVEPEKIEEASSVQENAPEEEAFLLQPPLVSDFEDTFDEKKKRIVSLALSLVRDNTKDDPTSAVKLLGDVIKCIKPIGGLCSMFGLDKLGLILNSMENTINDSLQLKEDPGFYPNNQKKCDVMISLFELSWQIRDSIITNSTEVVFFKDASNLTKYNKLIEKLGE